MATSGKHHWRKLNYSLATLMAIATSTTLRSQSFYVEETSITGIQRAIQSGQTSCRQVVQAYIDRAKAYNGVCTALVTKDGAPIAPTAGMMRAGSVLQYPSRTVAASLFFRIAISTPGLRWSWAGW